MSKILNDSELQEIRERQEALRYLYPQILGHQVLQDIPAIFQHLDALVAERDLALSSLETANAAHYSTIAQDEGRIDEAHYRATKAREDYNKALAALDAEAAAHSVTRAALVAAPEWELVPVVDAGYQRRCPICKRYDYRGHAPDCLRKVALEQAP